jgi:Zn finger protein HypA/HybF involved in hydrogenase expression
MDELKRVPGLCPQCRKPNKPILTPSELNSLGTPCDDCLKKLMAERPAKIMCRKCGRLAAYMKPGTTENGFEFVADREYHVPACKKCTPKYFRYDEIEEMET